MQNLRRQYPQIPEKARCRCNCTWQAGWKVSASSMKSKLQIRWAKKSICNSEYLGSADTSVVNRASATANIKLVQIHQLPQRHLYKQITSWYRYIRHQKSKSIIAPPISITIHHKARKDYAIQRIGVGLARRSWAGLHSLFLAWGCRELNSYQGN